MVIYMAMKLALNTLGCPDYSLDKVISVSKSLGFNGIEIRGLGGILDTKNIPELSEQGSDYFKSTLKNNCLNAVCLCTSASFHDADKLLFSINEAKYDIICAYRCEIPAIRVFGNNIKSAGEEPDTLTRVISAIRQLCRFSRDIQIQNYPYLSSPVKILLEAHGDFNTTRILRYICDNVDDDAFGIIWDIAHTDRAFNDGEGNYFDFYNKLGKYINHLHIKDHRKSGDKYTLCSIGKGTIPIREIISLLKENGFDGYYSYELEKRWHPELPDPKEEFPRFIEFMNTI